MKNYNLQYSVNTVHSILMNPADFIGCEYQNTRKMLGNTDTSQLAGHMWREKHKI